LPRRAAGDHYPNDPIRFHPGGHTVDFRVRPDRDAPKRPVDPRAGRCAVASLRAVDADGAAGVPGSHLLASRVADRVAFSSLAETALAECHAHLAHVPAVLTEEHGVLVGLHHDGGAATRTGVGAGCSQCDEEDRQIMITPPGVGATRWSRRRESGAAEGRHAGVLLSSERD
jgi:hypothetical protein